MRINFKVKCKVKPVHIKLCGVNATVGPVTVNFSKENAVTTVDTIHVTYESLNSENCLQTHDIFSSKASQNIQTQQQEPVVKYTSNISESGKHSSVIVNTPIFTFSPQLFKALMNKIKAFKTLLLLLDLLFQMYSNMCDSLDDFLTSEDTPTIDFSFEIFSKEWMVSVVDKLWEERFSLSGDTSLYYSVDSFSNSKIRLVLMNYQISSVMHRLMKLPHLLLPTTTIIVLNKPKNELKWDLDIQNDNLSVVLTSSDICIVKQFWTELIDREEMKESTGMYTMKKYKIERRGCVERKKRKEWFKEVRIKTLIEIVIQKDVNEGDRWWSYPLFKFYLDDLDITQIKNDKVENVYSGGLKVTLQNYSADLDRWISVIEPSVFVLGNTPTHRPKLFTSEFDINVFPSLVKECSDFLICCDNTPSTQGRYDESNDITFENQTPLDIELSSCNQSFKIAAYASGTIMLDHTLLISVKNFAEIKIAFATCEAPLMRGERYCGSLLFVVHFGKIVMSSSLNVFNHTSDRLDLIFKSRTNPNPCLLSLSKFEQKSFHPVLTTIPLYFDSHNKAIEITERIQRQFVGRVFSEHFVMKNNHYTLLAVNTKHNKSMMTTLHIFNSFQFINNTPYHLTLILIADALKQKAQIKANDITTFPLLPQIIKFKLEGPDNLALYEEIPEPLKDPCVFICNDVVNQDVVYDISDSVKGKLTTLDNTLSFEIFMTGFVRNLTPLPLPINSIDVPNLKRQFPIARYFKIHTKQLDFDSFEKTDLEIQTRTEKHHYIVTVEDTHLDSSFSQHEVECPICGITKVVTVRPKFLVKNKTKFTFEYVTEENKEMRIALEPNDQHEVFYTQILVYLHNVPRLINLDETISGDVFFDGILKIDTRAERSGNYVTEIKGCAAPVMRIENELDVPLHFHQKGCKVSFEVPSLHGQVIAWEHLGKEKILVVNGGEVCPYKMTDQNFSVKDPRTKEEKTLRVEFISERGICMRICMSRNIEENNEEKNHMECTMMVIGVSLYDANLDEVLFFNGYGVTAIYSDKEESEFEICCDYFQIDNVSAHYDDVCTLVRADEDHLDWTEDPTQKMIHFSGRFKVLGNYKIYLRFLTFNMQSLRVESDTNSINEVLKVIRQYQVLEKVNKKSEQSPSLELIANYLCINPVNLHIKISGKSVDNPVHPIFKKLSSVSAIDLNVSTSKFDVNENALTIKELINNYKETILKEYGMGRILKMLLGLYTPSPILPLGAVIFRISNSSTFEGGKYLPYYVLKSSGESPIQTSGRLGIRVVKCLETCVEDFDIDQMKDRRKPGRRGLVDLFNLHRELGVSLCGQISGFKEFVGLVNRKGEHLIALWSVNGSAIQSIKYEKVGICLTLGDKSQYIAEGFSKSRINDVKEMIQKEGIKIETILFG
ncbi:hypothetical protein EIN_335510 [Entamoeba invadens IP1]|uniref:Uncharacterized protein n=1 Tax=Entamoeba invadens IP1 TaxID=370355 RepID=L7FM25_ENTIV|nr:hypothetical protein EIN_335510 [Entamoeba invadens IP1]ELP88569.1 hypothetical protein EIN_335510 [Entamoeba invadens IP1]|eukprot:XP_004255340.1 hypothetical protein EIN_335510 [Entamoeba invadens IP1]